ncbi:hypothetical protein RI570_12745 [Brucella pseudogrignonensis]|uniref:hypothetical protein n=1 Tax=Brucella pseudogrignonensis TaxID=419475 RepID=UPI0028B65F2C|nr:hypothetical protein [Brucella pseudogrignonensis]MDT6941011.1 hypothetical protein [Brucella pseudogrignonensis]
MEELFNIMGHEFDRALAGTELERANDIQRFHSHTDAYTSPADRPSTSIARVSACRPYQRAIVGPYDRPSLPTHRNLTTNGFSIDELLGNRIASDDTIPRLADLVSMRPPTPDPRYRELVHHKWVPSNWDGHGGPSVYATTFNGAKKAIEENRGVGAGFQRPELSLFSRSWKSDVNTLMQRRAKVMIHGKKFNIDHSELLYKNRDHLIDYFHGDTRSVDNLLNWWEKL